MTAPLRRVLVRRPVGVDRWREYGWRAEPDAAARRGARGLRRGARGAARRSSSRRAARRASTRSTSSIPPRLRSRARSCFGRARSSGGSRSTRSRGPPGCGRPDCSRDSRRPRSRRAATCSGSTSGRSSSGAATGRTTRASTRCARRLPGVEVVAVDLPHCAAAARCMHLLSLISPLANDLAVVHLPLMPVRLVELLEARGIEIVEVPDEEFETMGCNVLALAPRVALALDGNPETRRRLEAAGVEVLAYTGDELSRKGDGGPTCLTRPLATRLERSPAPARRPPPASAAGGTPSTSEPGSRITTGRPRRDGETDLRERAPATADRDHGVARGDDREVPRMPDAGDDDVVDPLVRPGARLAREDPDRRPARGLRAARRRRHHLVEAAADDRRAALGEQPPDLLRRASCSAPLPITETCSSWRPPAQRRGAERERGKVTARPITATRATSRASPPSPRARARRRRRSSAAPTRSPRARRHPVPRHDQPAEQDLRQHERRHELHGLELGLRERAQEQAERHAEQRVADGEHEHDGTDPATSRPSSPNADRRRRIACTAATRANASP